VRLAPAGRAQPVRRPTRLDRFGRRHWPTVPRYCLVRLQLAPPPGTPLDHPACTRAREVFSECAEDHPRRLPNRYRTAGRAASRQGSPINRAPYAAQRPALPPPSPPPPFSDTNTRRHPAGARRTGSRRGGHVPVCHPPTAPRLARHRDQHALANAEASPGFRTRSRCPPACQRRPRGSCICATNDTELERRDDRLALAERGAARPRTVLARLQLTPTAELDEERASGDELQSRVLPPKCGRREAPKPSSGCGSIRTRDPCRVLIGPTSARYLRTSRPLSSRRGTRAIAGLSARARAFMQLSEHRGCPRFESASPHQPCLQAAGRTGPPPPCPSRPVSDKQVSAAGDVVAARMVDASGRRTCNASAVVRDGRQASSTSLSVAH
jgi:hypothetical protein